MPAKVLKCPTKGNKTANAYAYNGFADGLTLGEITDHTQAVMFADGNAANNIALLNTDLDARHNGKLIVGYLDGHVAMSPGNNTSVLLSLILQPVTNYSWLQLPAASVTTFVGSSAASAGNGNGEPNDFRWGDWVWIPNNTLTANGTLDYWAGVMFQRAMPVSSVRVQLWSSEGATLKKFYLQGSTDGSNFSDIGSYDYGSLQNNTRLLRDITVTAGDYKAVRVLFKAGDYTYGSAARGGPGLLILEPSGSGAIPFDEVNWAQKATFTTETANGGALYFNGLRYNDGSLFDDEGVRTGRNSGNWIAGEYSQIDLKSARKINKSVVVWDWIYGASSYEISYSNDGTNFTTVANKSAFIDYSARAAGGYSFDTANARYWRISMCAGGGGYDLLNQIMFYGPQ